MWKVFVTLMCIYSYNSCGFFFHINMLVELHRESFDVYNLRNFLFNFFLIKIYKWVFVMFKTPSIKILKKLLSECKFLWNIIVKGIEILILNFLNIICVFEIHGRKMVWDINYI
jgi:hypothetical protein